MSGFESPVFDGDTHYYESRDAFTRHVAQEHRQLAIRPIRDGAGHERILAAGREFTYGPPMYDRVAPPGALRAMLRSKFTGDAERFWESVSVEMDRAFVDREARLALLDQEGIGACFMFPGLGVAVEEFLRDHPVALFANLRALNRWILEEWGFGSDGRIFAAVMLSLLDLKVAVAELDWALAAGARVVYLRPAPVGGRSLADPCFDPFWARIEESGTVVAFHISDSGYNRVLGAFWGERPDPPSHEQSAWQWVNCMGDRPIMDTLSALVMHNLFGRFPGVRVLSVENGSAWVPYLLHSMDKKVGMGRYGPWPGGQLPDRPSRIFRRHVFVSPYPEDDLGPLIDAIGAERIVFGSDYPHPEGIAHLRDYEEQLAGLDEASVRCIMAENATTLLGLGSTSLLVPRSASGSGSLSSTSSAASAVPAGPGAC